MLSPNQRETVRCPHCELNQFVTASALCRRCHNGLIPAAKPAALPAPLVLVPMPPGEFRIAKAIRELRLALNLSQRQLAKRMGCNRTYVSKIEAGRVVPTVATLDRFAKGLRVNISALLRCDATAAMMEDPFLAEIAPLIAQLDPDYRIIVLKTLRQLTARGER